MMRAAAVLFAAGLMLLSHPYKGIWHDSVLYLGQALALLDPAPFQHDLFFAYGSQAKFTVFPRLMAWLCARVAPTDLFLWLTLAGLSAFAIASWQLIRHILPIGSRYPALIAVLCLPGSYGAWASLSYAEPFLTGRTFAEPLVLLSLCGLFARRYWLAGVAWCVAAALHPLQALPALVIAWFWLVQGDRRWLHLAWALIPLTTCFLLPQLDFLLLRMDTTWYSQVLERNYLVFYSSSGPSNWYYLLTDIFIGAVALYVAGGHLRRYLIALLTSSVLLLAAGLLLADAWHSAWVAGLQLWRVHWLLHWSAMASLPWLCLQLWTSEPGTWRPRLGIFASTVLLGCTATQANPLVPSMALLFIAWPWLVRHLSAPLQASIATSVVIVGLFHFVVASGLPQQWGFWRPFIQWPSLLMQSFLPIIPILFIVFAQWLWERAGRLTECMLLAAAFLTFLAAVLTWDQRPALDRSFTSDAAGRMPFGVQLPVDSQIEWVGQLLPVWSVLHRSHYVQAQQLAGIVFNRTTSLEGYRRKAQLHVKDGQGRDCPIVVLHRDFVPCNPDDFAVRQACRNTLGELDYFVLPYPLKSEPKGTWSPFGAKGTTYYLYACQELMGVEMPTTSKTRTEPSP